MLGPVALVFPASSAGEGRVFQAVSAERLREILEAAYGPDFDPALDERASQLQAIARALTENRMADALIGAVHLRLPELSEAAVQRLAALAKYSPDQLRVPKGNPSGGQWTRVGGASGPPTGRPGSPVQLVSYKVPPSEPRSVPVDPDRGQAEDSGASGGDDSAAWQAKLDQMAKEALSTLLSRSAAENQTYVALIYTDSANTYHVGGLVQGGMLSIFTSALYDRAYWSLYNSGQDVRGIAAILVTHYSNMPGGVPEAIMPDERIKARAEGIELYVATPSGRVVNYDGVTNQVRNVGSIRP